ncbi:MAG: hypothetical protein AB1758_15945 [Candidatus Eremiobacterota bacterium]
MIRELRSIYPYEFGGVRVRQSVDRCPATGESLHYWYDHEDGKHGFHYYPLDNEQKLLHAYSIDRDRLDLTGQVSLSADGYTAVGQVRRKDGTCELIELPLRRRFPSRLLGVLERMGWRSPRVLATLPEPARAFDLGPRGELAVALGDTVHFLEAGQLKPWKTFQTRIQDVEYLSDGTLCVMTEARPTDLGPTFHLGGGQGPPLQGSAPVSLSLRDVHPEAYRSSVEVPCSSVAFLKDAPFEEKERFVERCAWLVDASGKSRWAPHVALGNGRVAVLGDTTPTLWQFDPATGDATRGATLEPCDMAGWDRLRWFDGGLAVLPPDGKPASVPLWDGASGALLGVLPLVTGVEVADERLKFTDPTGGEHTVRLRDVGALKEEPWYRQAMASLALGSRTVAGPAAGVRVENGQLRVGNTRVRLNTRFWR